jgi:DNA-binding CsgD family transcriptional regulator
VPKGEIVAEAGTGIDRARDALARGAWADAYEELSAADRSTLTPHDLEGLADAAWWVSRLEESLDARQKAYAAYVAEGDERAAGAVAARLAIEHFVREESAIGAGYLMRAQRHLQDLSACAEQGFLAVVEANVARFAGELDRTLASARRAIEIGQRFGDRNLVAMAIHTEGLALIDAGEVPEGLALLDEAMTAVLAGDLSPYFTGIIYCNLIQACLELSDVRRAGEWSDAARVWCDALQPDAPFPGMCRVNRAEVARLRGAWPEAEAEALLASEEMATLEPGLAAAALNQVGEVRRRTGDVDGAEAAFARAHELGADPQPGLALLRLAQGKVEAARTGLRLTLGAEHQRPRRTRLLAAQVEVALATEDLDEAGAAVDELEAMAREAGTPAFAASAATAAGALHLAAGDVPDALERLREACAAWQALKLPYEAARARVLYAQAIRAGGDEEGAALELRAALAAFERLGARPDVATTSRLLEGSEALPAGLTAREAEVLRLVAAGKTNRDIAVELVISEHTVARHLQNIFAKLDVSSRSAATAFAFEHGLT